MVLCTLVCCGCRTQPIIMEKTSAEDSFSAVEEDQPSAGDGSQKSDNPNGNGGADAERPKADNQNSPTASVYTGDDTAQAGNSQPGAGTFAKPQIAVFVCGAVNDPGVYYLPEGSRCNDAVNAADGFAADAATDWINLAREVTDGEKLIVPTKEEASEMTRDGAPLATGEAAGEANVPASGQSGMTDGLVNLNTASKEQLMTLSGIGESKAQAIIQYRQEHGGFKSTEEIQQVSGIGDAIFEKIHTLITV